MGAAGDARIAFVVDGAIEQRTGGYLYDRLVADGLRARGDDVEIVSLPTDARNFADAHRRVREALARDDLDLVVIDELCHPRATLAAIASRIERSTRRPRVVTLVHHLAASERTGAPRLARLAVERALLAASDRVVATSETTRRLLEALGVPRRRVSIALPGRDRLGEASAPSAPSAEARFLFLGALTARKDPLAALRATFRAVAGPARLPSSDPPIAIARWRSRFGARRRTSGRGSSSGARSTTRAPARRSATATCS